MTSYNGERKRRVPSQDPGHLGPLSIVLFRVRHVLPVVSFNPNLRSPQPASGLPNRRPPSAFNLHLPIYRHHQWCMRSFNASHIFPEISFRLTRLYGPLPAIALSCIKSSLGPEVSSLPLPRFHVFSISCRLSSFQIWSHSLPPVSNRARLMGVSSL